MSFRLLAVLAAVMLGANTAWAQSIFTASQDTYIDASNQSASFGSAQLLEANDLGGGTGNFAGQRYPLIFFDIPTSTLQDFVTAWDESGGNFSKVNAVGSFYAFDGPGGRPDSYQLRQTNLDWTGLGENNVTFANADNGSAPTTPLNNDADGNNDGAIADNPFFGTTIGSRAYGLKQHNGGATLVRSILEFAEAEGIVSTVGGQGQALDPHENNGFTINAQGGGNNALIASKEYAAEFGAQFAPTLALYVERDVTDVTDQLNVLDVYQPPGAPNPFGNTSPDFPGVGTPVTPYAPDDANGNAWFESDYDITGIAGWNEAPDSTGPAFVNNGGVYGHDATVDTELDPSWDGSMSAQTFQDRNGFLFRGEFTVEDPESFDIMRFDLEGNGGVQVFLNGVLIAQLNHDNVDFLEGADDAGFPFVEEGFTLEGVTADLGNELEYVPEFNGRADDFEIFLDQFPGLLQETNTLAFHASNRSENENTGFTFAVDSLQLLSNTDLVIRDEPPRVIPEPTSVFLVAGLGLLGLSRRNRRAH